MKASRIDVNKANKYGNTPFANACIEGKLDIIKYMMNDSRIDVNKINTDEVTPFAIVCLQSIICSVSVQLLDCMQSNN